MSIWARARGWRRRTRVAKVDSYTRWLLYVLVCAYPLLNGVSALFRSESLPARVMDALCVVQVLLGAAGGGAPGVGAPEVSALGVSAPGVSAPGVGASPGPAGSVPEEGGRAASGGSGGSGSRGGSGGRPAVGAGSWLGGEA
ncbi:hypothetical protein ACFY1P_24445 [Streptomyces sp. NPDC001407]|uniref:hypothetical protein n=1 Tax=Streptomyces sp. NPDC001407 TaxID=3364573 RepID=UPI0036AA4864